jgi:periplasmic divalent cation tolerance protein
MRGRARAGVVASSRMAEAKLSIVMMTAPSEAVAAAIGLALVQEKLAACMNIVGGLRSIYSWQGKICDEAEVLCLIKTRPALFAQVRQRIGELHPYEVPEIVRLDADDAADSYLAWMLESTRAP